MERTAYPLACAVCDICGAPTLDVVTIGAEDGAPVDVCAMCQEDEP